MLSQLLSLPSHQLYIVPTTGRPRIVSELPQNTRFLTEARLILNNPRFAVVMCAGRISNAWTRQSEGRVSYV